MALNPASASASINPNQAQPQDSLDAYNQFSMNYATRGNPNGPSVGALGPSYQDWTNAGSPTDYQGYVNYFNKPQNPSNPQVMQGTANPNPTDTSNPTAFQSDNGYGMFAVSPQNPSVSPQLPSNWQSTYTGMSADMVGWQPSIQDYASNNSAGFTLPSNYSSPSVGLSTPVTGGGLSSLLNTGTPTMATNPLSQMTPSTPTTGFTPAPNLGVTPGTSATGSFSQGAPLPVTSTVQQAVTAAPSFYTDYLNQLATQGANTAQNAQFVGAQPLQQQAFNQVAQNVGNYQPTLQNAINLASSVGGSNLAQAVGDLGQANIANYLAPQATAGLVGSGQFGSSRGAQALGSTIANAELGITAQQQQALQQDMANRLAASGQLGNLASQTQALGLGDINALSTLGGQQQTIAQNEQLFPMQQLTNESALLRGYTIPTSVSQAVTGPGQQGQFAQSPLQQIMGIGSLVSGLASPNASGTSAGGNILSGLGLSGLGTSLQQYLNSFNPTIASGVGTITDPTSPYYTGLSMNDINRPLPTTGNDLSYLDQYSTPTTQ